MRRIIAGLIDYSIIYGFLLFFVFTYGQPNNDGGYSISGFPSFAPICFWFLMTVGFESGLGGTIGNSLVGLKAIPLNGNNRKLTFIESLKRHLLDPVDMFFFGLVGIVTINNTKNNQRVGDIWAKTIVVPLKSS
ncbi:RDD family protein [Patiriisocius hiemis]|uniref:RDD family protein n=1 Tax=Patiriisocius hiemis TaxID=3075604 RepID=A0ABU2YB43_9FLAO|nr:RDD family protein [Constantimarinum sp. W242]MDT0555408.1 RDD family protein [Constantimarinum sp. W242]